MGVFVAEMHGGCIPVPRRCSPSATLGEALSGILAGMSYEKDDGRYDLIFILAWQRKIFKKKKIPFLFFFPSTRWKTASVHRTWVINESEQVVGVITFTDIIAKLGRYGW